MKAHQLYCKTHDGYYTPPRCSPLCTLLGSWSEPKRDPEAESRARVAQESGDLCREAAIRYGSKPQ